MRMCVYVHKNDKDYSSALTNNNSGLLKFLLAVHSQGITIILFRQNHFLGRYYFFQLKENSFFVHQH